jgi:hypothetical protein
LKRKNTKGKKNLFSLKSNRQFYMENSMKNCWADGGGMDGRRIEEAQSPTVGEFLESRGG